MTEELLWFSGLPWNRGSDGKRRSMFLGERLSGFANEGLIAGSEFLEILLGLTQAERPIRTTAHRIRILLVLPIILPPANRAHFKTAATIEGFEFTARTPIGLSLLCRF